MQIPILNGIYTSETGDFRVSYPVNMIPVPVSNGISTGYLRPADGIIQHGSSEGPGINRAGINWNDVCYRIMGTKLVSISSTGAITTLGEVGGTVASQGTLDYSFDRLAIASNENLFYWDGAALTQVTDPDLGVVLDVIWVDGYFMTTDGEFLVVTELSDPTLVNPLKYGSSEADPDPIKSLLKLKNEPVALNRYTIEFFDNIGGSLFPFQRIEGAQVQRGVVGTHACGVFLESVAFVGGGRNESIGVWLASGGSSTKISTREIDLILNELTSAELEDLLVEIKVDKGHQHLMIHTPTKVMVFDGAASQKVNGPVWFCLTSSATGLAEYRGRDLVWCYNKWLVGDSNTAKVGYLTDSSAEHWGEVIAWEFGTVINYNQGMGGIFHELELVALTGRAALSVDEYVSTQYSTDGITWSQLKYIKAGKQGFRNKRLVWIGQGAMRNWRIQRFKGVSSTMTSIARLEAKIEPLGV
jgi:hypothetical protein